jgi:hypothetical protein
MRAAAGSFIIPSAVAPQNTVVSGLPFSPTGGIILISGSGLDATFSTGALGLTFGFLSAVGEQFCVTEGSQDAQTTQNTGCRAAAAGTGFYSLAAQPGGGLGVDAIAALASIDSGGFTLTWSDTSSSGSRVVFWLAFGDEVIAKAHSWSMPTSAGNKSVTTLGGRPDLVLFLAADESITALGTSVLGSRMRIGAMDARGNQWAISHSSEDSTGVANTDTERTLVSDACLIGTSTNTLRFKASFVSMDADGYTVNFSTAPATAGVVVALALRNLSASVGVTTKPTGGAPATHAITGRNHRPKAVLLAGVQNTSSASIAAHAEACVGVAVVGTQGSVAKVDRDNLATSKSSRYTDTTKVYTKADNGTPAVDASAALASFDEDGLTLTWNPNDAVATEIAFVTFGDMPRRRGGGTVYPRRGANVGRKQRGAWRRRAA